MKISELANIIRNWYKDKYNLTRYITKVKDGIYIHTNMNYKEHKFKLFVRLDDFVKYPNLTYNYIENSDDEVIHIIEGN